MLDLVAEVAAEDVEQPAAGQVRRAEHLAQVPAAARLVLGLLLGELLDALGEVAAEDDHERPDVADEVRGQVAGQHERRAGPGEQRERDVVLEHLAASLAPDRAEDVALVAELDLPGLDPVDLEVVRRRRPTGTAARAGSRRSGCRDRGCATADPRTSAGSRSRCRGPCRARWCACGACSCGNGATDRRGRPCPIQSAWSRAPGPSSSRTGRASRCGRSPCCRGSSTATGR